MGRFLLCSLPVRSDKRQDDSDQLPSFLRSGSSSFSNSSSLSSQPSLPSVPSLTLPAFDQSAACHHCLTTLAGHSSYVFSLALAGKHLYSGASDGEIRLWNRNSSSVGDCVNGNNTVAEGYSGVKSIVISGDRVFSAHHDHRIRVWKIDHSAAAQQKCKLVTILPKLSDRCMSLLSPKNYVKIRRHKRRTWIHHVDAVSALALTVDGTLLYSVSWDRTLKIWRTSDYKCLESIQNAHDDAINAVVLSTDGYVYTASADKLIKVWRKSDGPDNKKHALVSTLQKHRSAVNALALSADGSVLYSGACDRSIIVWKKDSGAHMAVAGALRGHTKAVLCLATAADLVCSGSTDRTVRVWRRSASGSYSVMAVLEGHRNPVKCLTAAVGGETGNRGDESANSYLIYSGGLDFEIRAWEIWVPN